MAPIETALKATGAKRKAEKTEGQKIAEVAAASAETMDNLYWGPQTVTRSPSLILPAYRPTVASD